MQGAKSSDAVARPLGQGRSPCRSRTNIVVGLPIRPCREAVANLTRIDHTRAAINLGAAAARRLPRDGSAAGCPTELPSAEPPALDAGRKTELSLWKVTSGA